MIVTGSSAAFLIGSVITWRGLALTGKLKPCKRWYCSFDVEFRVELKYQRKVDSVPVVLQRAECHFWICFQGLVPCIFLLVGLCFVPESPRWLVSSCFVQALAALTLSIWEGGLTKTYVSRQKLASRKNSELHCRNYVEKMLMLLVKLLKSKYLPSTMSYYLKQVP